MADKIPKIEPILPSFTVKDDNTTQTDATITPDDRQPFTEKLNKDKVFIKILKSIGLMNIALENINKKIDQNNVLLTENKETGLSIESKVDRLQDTLETMLDNVDKERIEQEKVQREKDLENSIPERVGSTNLVNSLNPVELIKEFIREISTYSVKTVFATIFAGAQLVAYRKEIYKQVDSLVMSVGDWIVERFDTAMKSVGINLDLGKLTPQKNKPVPQQPIASNVTTNVPGYNPQGQKPKKTETYTNATAEEIHRGVSEKTNVSMTDLRTIGDIESSNNPNDETGSYQGLYQLRKKDGFDVKSSQYQITQMSNNIKYYQSRFEKYMGRQPTLGEWYLMHQQGPTGGLAIALAYYHKDYNITAARGAVKYAALILNTNLDETTIIRNIRSNWNFVKKYLPKEVSADNVTVKQYFEAFIQKVNDKKSKYEESPEKVTSSSPIPEASNSPPKDYKMDKSGGSNEPALDIITDTLSKEGIEIKKASFNDVHHQNTNSQHEDGLAVDISLKNPKDAFKVISRIRQMAKDAGIEDQIIIKDESTPQNYGKSKAKWTAPHVHVAFSNRAAAQKFMAFYNRPEKMYAQKEEKSPATPLGNEPQSGKQLLQAERGSDKKIVVVNNTQPQQKQYIPSTQPQNKGGISGIPPAAFNYNIKSFLHQIT